MNRRESSCALQPHRFFFNAQRARGVLRVKRALKNLYFFSEGGKKKKKIVRVKRALKKTVTGRSSRVLSCRTQLLYELKDIYTEYPLNA